MKDKTIIKLDPGGSNSYLIRGENGYLLVDAGMKGAAKKLGKQLADIDVEPDEISHIVITHDHYDHTGGLAEMKEMTGAVVMMHKAELDDNRGLVNQSIGIFRFLVGIFGVITPEGKPEEKIKPDVVMEGDTDLHQYGFDARIIHTPGHTPGSICIITDDRECIAGDTVFNMFPGTNYPIIVYDRDRLSKSYGRLKEENCTVFHPGHGEAISGERFRKKILENPRYFTA